MSRKFFGTDGIRGRVGEFPITPEFVLKLGWAAGRVLSEGGHGRVLIGKDTRISGYMFESALEAGFSAAGVDIRLLGPMPTPAIAYLTRTLHADAGVVISASHNPYHDNGIKFFSANGTKLPDDVELAIERELESEITMAEPAQLGKAERVVDAAGRYIEFCKSTLPAEMNLKGVKVVVDCAHGATYHIAPSVFDELGAEVVVIGAEPNGLNINEGCGATDLEALRASVLEHKADIGVALDGDGDRVMMVDHMGEVVDGDELLFVIATSKESAGCLQGGVVGTLMSNLGLEHAILEIGIGFERAKVGDRYVIEQLNNKGWRLGGESSGHIICLDRTTTGDGIVSALQVVAAMISSDATLHALKRRMTKYPQTMINVATKGGGDISASTAVQQEVAAVESELAERGRVLLRPSGTEPLVRVMVEGVDAVEVERLARRLAAVVEQAAAS
ncbi:phosphoglucosamine mutase [Solemya pervernicosa gill symbiont]|uniref:Phosphoglucosamine mutase n=2 Tax=Gammaproteobacteria incertae sedis TaxID=118884 RepID=A0A1T2L9E5_9GAMM|nr:phosphoglucosamine mutase [Candidatus Reidiella endopervernicosa]OOZ41738.1 phosphoglucosamine mutase [Solemya pervernicosa gill symbiont]QKQ26477.1 phosphoglucosamine mutase [Candidatus Reidiella endopervernicosa]